MEMLKGTAFALRPDYEHLVNELGQPPLGVPDELTFAYAWDLACKKIDRENKTAEQARKRSSELDANAKIFEEAFSPVKKVPAKRASKRAPAKKARPTVSSRLDAEFGK